MRTTLIVGDLGNSSLKLGEFPNPTKSGSLVQPIRVFTCKWEDLTRPQFDDWLQECETTNIVWRLGSVNHRGKQTLIDWIDDRGESRCILSHSDFSIPILVRSPELLGMDRLAAAHAANLLRNPQQAAIIVDVGTAITIDCVSVNGDFLGGTIAPGFQLKLDALHQFTDKLPRTTLRSVPPLIGNQTEQAIQAGVFWTTTLGVDGMIRHLMHELASPCAVFGTGGGMELMLPYLNHPVQHHHHLVLSGLAFTP